MPRASRIRVLSDVIANKIAAGEVIERPASVVKELVENAIDAEATRIFIEIRDGGKTLIKITDNGSGMNKDDAVLAFERHATSKLSSFEDLDWIGSFGFRGEAVPSIAAVSRVLLTTATGNEDPGTEVLIAGGKLINVREVLREQGTTFEVHNLFYNVPARRKYLKAVFTELSHITDTVTNLALANPQIHLRLLCDGKLTLDFPAGESLQSRVFQVIGLDDRADLIPIHHQSGEWQLSGFVSKPSGARTASRHQKLFINRRFIRDRIITSAIYKAYRNAIPDNRHPVVFIFLQVPPSDVDFNVHPKKIEVRFHAAERVHWFVEEGIKKALDQALAEFQPLNRGIASETHSLPDYSFTPARSEPLRQLASTFEAGNSAALKAEPSPSDARTLQEASPEYPAHTSNLRAAPQTTLFTASTMPRIIGQLNLTFIILEDQGDLLLIDQHTAHERVLFERFSELRQTVKAEKQKELLPRSFELAPRDAHLLQQYLETLTAFGFELEQFGRNTFKVTAVPVLLASHDPVPLIRDMIDELAEVSATSGPTDQLAAIIKVMACKAAVKANSQLSLEEMTALVAEVFRPGRPDTCPHGRPIVMRIPLKDIHRFFHR